MSDFMPGDMVLYHGIKCEVLYRHIAQRNLYCIMDHKNLGVAIHAMEGDLELLDPKIRRHVLEPEIARKRTLMLTEEEARDLKNRGMYVWRAECN